MLTEAAGPRLFGEEDLGVDLFVAVAAGSDPRAVLDDLNRNLDNEAYVVERGAPADLVNFGRVEQIPLVLGGILAALAATTLVHTLVSGIRRRQRDLAVLKALGFTRRQTAAAVRWNALALAIVALLVGVPLGVTAGRLSWQELAGQLGVLSRPVVPTLGIIAVVAGTVVLAVVASAVPGLGAARLRPAQILRVER
ncbi:MAG TPA: FtsX-like permease family protein [Acidimicrobiales bacterium]|nr:FtsX-like permease family protein [Acidimicrobiales bacterium]